MKLGTRSTKPSALRRAKNIKRFSKRDMIALRWHADYVIDFRADHNQLRLLAFHKRRNRSRWLNNKTGEVITIYSANARDLGLVLLPVAA